MQAAKRMVLIDERVLESLQKRHDSSWKKPTEQVAKNNLNRIMETDLQQSSPDDVKVKQYN